MPTIELAGKAYDVDEDGFLQVLDNWSEDFAKAYAKEEGIEGNVAFLDFFSYQALHQTTGG